MMRVTRATPQGQETSPTRAREGPAAPLIPGRWDALLLDLIIAAAVVTPAITFTSRLPDIRVEQVLALIVPAVRVVRRGRTSADLTPRPPSLQGRGSYGLGSLPMWRSPFPKGKGAGGLGLIDLAFLTLALATLASIVYAPLALEERFSPRDGYEIVKLGLYWVLFRFGLSTARTAGARRGALLALLGAGCVSALVGLGQYLDPSGFGSSMGGWWAPAHHLRALLRDGRAFGTVGNPNYFGALLALLAVFALTERARAAAGGRIVRRASAAALVLAPLGVVLSGSRGALAALLAALLAVWVIAAISRAPMQRLTLATVLLTAAFAGSVLFVELLPRGRQDYLQRVAGELSPTSDGDLALRLERWRSVLGTSSTHDASGVPGSAVSTTGRPSAGEAARARDARRREDVRLLVEAVRRSRDRTGSLPAGPPLDVLAPADLERLPADPADGAAYGYERTAGGFTITTRIEDAADPDYPLVATGDARNYLANGDLEEADGLGAAGFRALPGTVYQRSPDAALYGSSGIVFRGNPSRPDRRAAVYQQRHLSRAGGAPFTAEVWVKLPEPMRGDVFLYTNIYYADGERQDPHARMAADGSLVGVWQRLAVGILPDPGRRVDFIGVYLLADDFAGEVYADGFALVDGSAPVSFTGLPEAGGNAPGLDADARFRRSPMFGSGPAKAEGGGVVDNEYLLVLARYGLVGLAAYLALWGAVLATALRRVREARAATPALAVAGGVIGLLVFDLVAGSLYHLQLMGVFWPVAGMALAGDRPSPRRGEGAESLG